MRKRGSFIGFPAIEAKIRARLQIADTGCWLWTGARARFGYGKVYVGRINDKPTVWPTHRAMYQVVHGQLPPDTNVLHKCDTPACCNPEHLTAGTQADNLADMKSKGRASQGERHGQIIRAAWTPIVRARKAAKMRKIHADRMEAARIADGAPEGTKRCCGCREWLPHSAFYKNARFKDGLKRYCKACDSAQAAERYRRKSLY